MTTWRKELTEAAEYKGEKLEDLKITLSDSELDEEFDDGYGCTGGKPFTAWSDKYVYFPICYDGSEWVGSVSRHPDVKPTRHQGGG